MDKLLNRSKEIFGYFIPLGSGKCEIHLYHDAIQKECTKCGFNENGAVKELSKYVIAHEMFHALHYADVMTESGRRIYKNKDFIKQGVVQEALAEYFALCYSKNLMELSHSLIDLDKYIRNIRDVKDFPVDGGYSGALIFESKEKTKQSGKDNVNYIQVYSDALRDMPKAYTHLV